MRCYCDIMPIVTSRLLLLFVLVVLVIMMILCKDLENRLRFD